MRPGLALALTLVVVLAGCTAPLGGGTTAAPEPNTTAPATTPTAAPTDTPTSGTPTPGTPTPDDGNGSGMVDHLPDPPSDTIGWEAGLWYNETINVTNADGLNASERELAVARAMARVEHVRQLEFPGNETIPTDVISREEFKARQSGSRNYSAAYRTFDNVKFEALLFVGEDRDSIAVQQSNLGSTVSGYYSPTNDSIVLISEGDLPTFDGEETLSQEVAHALQDQRFDLPALQQSLETRDGHTGYLGLVEGDGNLIDELYVEACNATWRCIPAATNMSNGSSSPDIHFGIYLMDYLPYSDGPGFIRYHYKQGGWERINGMYSDLPKSAEQIVYPEKYGSDPPVDVSLSDQTSQSWERVRPGPQAGADYDTLGIGGIAPMFMYTSYSDYNSSKLFNPLEFLNYDANGLNRSDPIDYDFEFTRGWEGDRIHVYQQVSTDKTGYVWRLVWESPGDAREFADAYRRLLSYWGGDPAGGSRWVLPEDSPFTDAFDVRVDGDTVTIVNAPTIDELGDVYGPAAE